MATVERADGFSAMIGLNTWWLEPDSTPADLTILMEELSVYSGTIGKGESGGHVKCLEGSGGYRSCSASLRKKCIQALVRRMGTAKEEKLHTQVHRECTRMKYGLLQIKQKPQGSPK